MTAHSALSLSVSPKAGEDGSSPRVGFSPYQLSLGEVHDVSTMLEKLSLGRTGLGKDVGRPNRVLYKQSVCVNAM